VRASKAAHDAYASLRQDFKVDVVDGKVAGVTVMTLGPNGPERVLQDLKERFGQPTSQRLETGTGAGFRPTIAEWRLSDGVVNFSGAAPGYPVAVVEIESQDFYDRPVPNGPGAGPGPIVITPPSGDRDHQARAVALLTALRTTGVSMHRLRMILELDEVALEKYPLSDRQTLRKLHDDYSLIVKGAEFAMTPMGRRLLGVSP